jgi:hypothetical protein
MPAELLALLRVLADGGLATFLLLLLVVENIVLYRALRRGDLVIGWVYQQKHEAHQKADNANDRSSKTIREFTGPLARIADELVAIRKHMDESADDRRRGP